MLHKKNSFLWWSVEDWGGGCLGSHSLREEAAPSSGGAAADTCVCFAK